MLDDLIKELEKIIEEIDNGTSIEKGIELFEKGVNVTKECLEYLKTQKGKITQIKEEMDKIIEKPLDIENE